MKIISGSLRGRNIKGYNIDGTRPTMARVKESMFAILQNDIKDSVCLDLFSGSGNLGIEAISNGAKQCYFVDNNKIAINAIKYNIENLNIKDKCEVIFSDYKKALEKFKNAKMKFNIVFLDPPYNDDIIGEILDYLYKNKLLKRDAIVICEYEREGIKNDYYEIEKERNFGYRTVGMYVPKEEKL